MNKADLIAKLAPKLNINQDEARERTKQKEQQRKDDTRRKILLGSYLIKKMQNEANKEKILAELNEYLTENRDRQLFDLPNIEEN